MDILSKENVGLLDLPGLSIIGILSSLIKIQEIIDEYPGKLIIDCDTNEIFGENYLEPFEPQKFIPNIRDEKGLKNAYMKDRNDNKIEGDNIKVGKLTKLTNDIKVEVHNASKQK